MQPRQLRSFILLIARSSPEEFAQAYLESYLVAYLPTIDEPQRWTFETARLDLESYRAGTWLADQGLALDDAAESYAVWPVSRAPKNTEAHLTVGRVPGNDVVLASASVSKLHARLFAAADGGVELADAGSSNGTELRRQKLKPEERHRLATLDQIRFGAVECRFYDARAFHDFGRKHIIPAKRG